jgi:predicted TPR repeat methyltransferase
MPKSQQPEHGEQMLVNSIPPQSVVLDIGAGEGKWGLLLRGRARYVDAIEVWPDNALKCLKSGIYRQVFETDVRDFEWKKDEYDVVVLGDVLEHLPHHDAIKLLDTIRANVKQICLAIPINVCHQDGSFWGNPFETHLYHWHDYELRTKQGFELLNIGVNENGLVAIGAYVWRRR